MSKKKKHCKKTAHRDNRMQDLRNLLMDSVPRRVREIIDDGKANDDAWLIERIRWAKSVEPSELFAQGKIKEWEDRMTEMFAVLSFMPGGSTGALGGVKLLGLHFDAETIVGRKVRY